MANYVTGTSDKLKKKAVLWWEIGCFGLFGFEYFYVGKVKQGIIRLILAIFMIGVEVTVLTDPENHSIVLPMTISLVAVWAVLALINLFKIKIGTFKDNAGQNLRQ